MKKLIRMLTNPYIAGAILLVAIFEFAMLVRHDFFKNALIERGYLKQDPTERRDFQCLQGWENTLNKMGYKADVCFFGNSLTYNSDFQKDYPDIKIVNLGYSGDGLEGMIARHKQVSAVHPDKIFIMAGCNDIGKKRISLTTFNDLYNQLIDSMQVSNPGATIYLQSILPVNHELKPRMYPTSLIIEANTIIEEIAKQHFLTYIDLFSLYADENNELDKRLTTDGQHLKPSAYKIWSNAIEDYLLNN